MRPLEAYEAVMRFSAERGEPTLHLALHAAVPQTFRPDLLHLIRLNFVPEAPHEAEADVLLAPFCEDIGGGYYQLDPEARRLLLVHLDPTYPEEKVSRVQRVADFLVTYIATQRRRLSADQDRLAEDYLSIQGWVALAFLQPEAAALQLAAALDQGTQGEVAARVQFSGLASALSVPLVQYPKLLTYAAGLEALEQGRGEDAAGLLGRLPDEEIRIGGVTLRSPRRLLAKREGGREQKAEEAAAPPYGSCFISYPYGDRSFVEWLRPALQSRGVRVWTAPDDLEEGKDAGEEKHAAIAEAIRSADTFLLVLSSRFRSSGGARFEAEVARRAGRPIVGLMINSPQKTLGPDFPETIANVDFNEWDDYDQSFAALLPLLVATAGSSPRSKAVLDEPQPVETEPGFIYLSYAQEDLPIAQTLLKEFERAGLRYATTLQLTDESEQEKHLGQIERSAVFVALLSRQALREPPRYLQREWELAAASAHERGADAPFLLPVLLEDDRKQAGLLPEIFYRTDWFHLQSYRDRQRLVEIVREIIQERERRPPPTPR